MITVSVILTTYNCECTLQRALNSIHSQEGINDIFKIELIVLDDCSTDKTREILCENKIEYFSTLTNSGGPNKGRNIGLSKATGDFICIMDHDDEWVPDKIRSQLALSKLAPIITSGHILINVENNKQLTLINKGDRQQDFILYDTNITFLNILTKIKKRQHTYLGSIMFNSDLKNILFEEHFGMIDFDWVSKLFHNRSSVEICKPLYKRYFSDNNLSLNEEYRLKDFYYSLMTIERYSLKYPKEVKLAYNRIHGSRARYYYLINNMKKARFYFLRSELNLLTILYYITTFAGSGIVRKIFNVFG